MAANLPAVKDPFAKPASPFPGRASSTRTNLLNKPPTPVTDTGGPKQINVKPSQINGKPPAPTPAPQPVAAPAPPAGPDPTTNAFNGIAPPGLNPDQMAAFNTAWNNYQGSLNTDNANLGLAGNPTGDINAAIANPSGAYGAALANDKASFVQNSETAQAAAASRGLFNSSIKDGALNDIQATQSNNDHIALGQLTSLSDSLNQDIARLSNNWRATAVGAVGNAVINGQNVPPTVPPASAAAAPGAPGSVAPSAAAVGNTYTPAQENAGNWQPVWAVNAGNVAGYQAATNANKATAAGAGNVPGYNAATNANKNVGYNAATNSNAAIAKNKAKGK